MNMFTFLEARGWLRRTNTCHVGLGPGTAHSRDKYTHTTVHGGPFTRTRRRSAPLDLVVPSTQWLPY